MEALQTKLTDPDFIEDSDGRCLFLIFLNSGRWNRDIVERGGQGLQAQDDKDQSQEATHIPKCYQLRADPTREGTGLET